LKYNFRKARTIYEQPLVFFGFWDTDFPFNKTVARRCALIDTKLFFLFFIPIRARK